MDEESKRKLYIMITGCQTEEEVRSLAGIPISAISMLVRGVERPTDEQAREDIEKACNYRQAIADNGWDAVLMTHSDNFEEILDWLERLKPDVLHLHSPLGVGKQSTELVKAIKEEYAQKHPERNLRIFKGVPVTSTQELYSIQNWLRSGLIDAIELDTADFERGMGAGTGKKGDWLGHQYIMDLCPPDTKFIFSGGLNQYNIKGVIQLSDPFGVDVYSGVRDKGKDRVDPDEVRKFATEATNYIRVEGKYKEPLPIPSPYWNRVDVGTEKYYQFYLEEFFKTGRGSRNKLITGPETYKLIEAGWELQNWGKGGETGSFVQRTLSRFPPRREGEQLTRRELARRDLKEKEEKDDWGR